MLDARQQSRAHVRRAPGGGLAPPGVAKKLTTLPLEAVKSAFTLGLRHRVSQVQVKTSDACAGLASSQSEPNSERQHTRTNENRASKFFLVQRLDWCQLHRPVTVLRLPVRRALAACATHTRLFHALESQASRRRRHQDGRAVLNDRPPGRACSSARRVMEMLTARCVSQMPWSVLHVGRCSRS